MIKMSKDLEEIRKSYRPQSVRVLFIGESPPANGNFFYDGNSNLAKYTREAFELVFEPCPNMKSFLESFEAKGCYLEDLCTDPVNNLPRIQRKAERRNAVSNLAKRISHLIPLAIVVVMRSIVPQVQQAMARGNAQDLPFFTLPFPAMSHQRNYVNGLVDVFGSLVDQGILIEN